MPANNQQLTICFVAGKSGGHVIPCLTLAQMWKQNHPDGHVLFLSTNTPLDQELTAHPVITQRYLFKLDSVPGKNLTKYPRFMYQALACFVRSIQALKKQRPERVISTGGYIAIPVVCAAYLLRVPVELWELNTEPGRTIAFLAPLAQSIKICFPEAQTKLPAKKTVLVDYPVRYANAEKITPAEAQKQLELARHGFMPERMTLFILGGSQGSTDLSATIAVLINKHPELAQKIQCIHQTGGQDQTNWHTWYQHNKIPALVFTYQDNLAAYFCAADIVLSRAGAGGIFETAFFGKKTIFMPLQTPQTNHQLKNAQAEAQRNPHRCFFGTDQQTIVDLLYNLMSQQNQ